MIPSGKIKAAAFILAILTFIPAILKEMASNIISDAVLLSLNRTSSEYPRDKSSVIENKPTPPKVDPAPLPPDRERERESVAWQQERERLALEQELDALRKQRDALKEALEFDKRAIDELKRERQVRREQHDAQNGPIEALRRRIDEMEKRAAKRGQAEPNRPFRAVAPIPQATPLLVYYRVALQRTKQAEYSSIKEIKHFLNSMKLSYVCGPTWKDSGLSSLWVPIAIHETDSWRSHAVKSAAHREWIMDKMLALGIETRFDKPEDFDD